MTTLEASPTSVDWQRRALLWRECARQLYHQRNESLEQLRRINVHLMALAEILERYETTLVAAGEAFQVIAEIRSTQAVDAAPDRLAGAT